MDHKVIFEYVAFIVLPGLFAVNVAFAVADFIVILLARIVKPTLSNKYYTFHKKYGFSLVLILKAIFLIFALSQLFDPPMAIGVIWPLLVYDAMVIKLVIDFFRNGAPPSNLSGQSINAQK